jgi:hypothetical protein
MTSNEWPATNDEQRMASNEQRTTDINLLATTYL